MFDWLINWVKSLWSDLTSWVSSAIDAVYSWVNSAINRVYSWALSTFAKLGEIASTIIKYVTEVYNTVKNYITNVYNTIVENITKVYQTVSNYVTNVYNTVVNNITNVIGVTIEKVGEWFASIGGATRAWVEGLFVTAKNVWDTITGNLGEWWKTQLAKINETFGWVLLFRDNIEEFFKDPLEWLVGKLEDWFWGVE